MTPPYLADDPPPWLDDVLSQVGFSSVCVKAGPHETCAAGTSFHLRLEARRNQALYIKNCFHSAKAVRELYMLKLESNVE